MIAHWDADPEELSIDQLIRLVRDMRAHIEATSHYDPVAAIMVRYDLKEHEAIVLQALDQNAGMPVSTTQLHHLLYAGRSEEDRPSLETIKVWINRLRGKLQSAGVVIETRYGKGYRLVKPLADLEPAE